jgi:hypothetical protein
MEAKRYETTISIAVQLVMTTPDESARQAAIGEITRYLTSWRRIPLAVSPSGIDIFVGNVAELQRRTPTASDTELLNAITVPPSADDGLENARRIHQYYINRSRADRTPRSFLYLHLGYLVATIDRLVVALRDATPPKH